MPRLLSRWRHRRAIRRGWARITRSYRPSGFAIFDNTFAVTSTATDFTLSATTKMMSRQEYADERHAFIRAAVNRGEREVMDFGVN